MPGYPPQYAQPSAGSAPYGLPQPISSGSLDLSAIKPVSSGTVNINDAIAQARSMAADRGIHHSIY